MTKVNQQELIARVEALMADAEEVGFGEAHNMVWSDKAPLTLADLRALQSLLVENERYLAALRLVEPHLDAIVCYASTMGEHEPNRIAHTIRTLLGDSQP